MIYHDYHSVILRLWSSRDLSKKGHRKIGFGLEIPGQISPLTVRIKSLKGSMRRNSTILLEKRAKISLVFQLISFVTWIQSSAGKIVFIIARRYLRYAVIQGVAELVVQTEKRRI